MNAHDSTPTTTKIATSEAVKTKAAHLACSYTGSGRFVVSSGSEPGKTYTVTTPFASRDPETWSCECEWSQYNGTMCSHVRAADRWMVRYEAKRAKAVAA